MKTQPIQLENVHYNAATQCFEALVTLYDGGQAHKYACAINAPISMSFKDAAAGLTKKAERMHGGLPALKSAVPWGALAAPLRGAVRIVTQSTSHIEIILNRKDRAA